MYKLLSVFIATIFSFTLSFPVWAVELNYAPATVYGKDLTIGAFVSPIIQNVSILAGLSAFVSAIFAGFRFVSSAGNAKETQNAANMLTFSLLGLALAVLSYWITKIVFAVGGAGTVIQ